MADNGASLRDRAVVNGAASVSAVPASVPSAGALGIIEHGLMLERHVVARVVKARPSGMWEVQVWRDGYSSGDWGSPHRREVAVWLPLPKDIDPATISRVVRNKAEAFHQEVIAHRKSYHSEMRAFAQAIEAGTAKTEGLGPKDESAVRKDAPHIDQEQP